METAQKTKLALDRKFQKIKMTPASFDFYISVHDFIEYIESTPSFDIFLRGAKAKRAVEIPKKYFSLKQIYQGIEDIDAKATKDLGHDRYSVIKELSSIRNRDVSESNSFWKRRESFRKLTGEVYKTLTTYLSE